MCIRSLGDLTRMIKPRPAVYDIHAFSHSKDSTSLDTILLHRMQRGMQVIAMVTSCQIFIFVDCHFVAFPSAYLPFLACPFADA